MGGTARARAKALPIPFAAKRRLRRAETAMTDKPSLIDSIVASEAFQEKIAKDMNDAFLRRLNRPGADGRAYRSFILDWLYLERPLFERFRARAIRSSSKARRSPSTSRTIRSAPMSIASSNGRISTRCARMTSMRNCARRSMPPEQWRGQSPLKFLPAHPQRPFADRADADAQAAEAIHAFASPNKKPEGDNDA
jgi:hypothetical protein